MPAGDYDPDKVKVGFPGGDSGFTLILSPTPDPQGHLVVMKVQIPYFLVFPSGRVEHYTYAIDPPPGVQEAFDGLSAYGVAAVMAYEGLNQLWLPAPPAPLPTVLNIASAAHAQASDVVTLEEEPAP